MTELEEKRDETEEPKHEVEAIVRYTISKRTEVKLRVKWAGDWVGYPPEQSTWELAWRVRDFVEEMHAEYLETHPAARRVWAKEN